MCIIIVGNATTKPDVTALKKCWARNPHGAGFAQYHEDGRVEWKKGITDLDEAIELIERATGDWVAHFRFITVGGDSHHLHHPFPISKTAPRDLEGLGNGSVLFHNGTWKEWKRGARDFSLNTADTQIPDGDMSDSRVIAWICAHKGYRFLNLLPGRYAVVTKSRGVKLFPPTKAGWTQIGGVWYSNTDWDRLMPRDGSRGKAVGGWTAGKGKGKATQSTFRDGGKSETWEERRDRQAAFRKRRDGDGVTPAEWGGISASAAKQATDAEFYDFLSEGDEDCDGGTAVIEREGPDAGVICESCNEAPAVASWGNQRICLECYPEPRSL